MTCVHEENNPYDIFPIKVCETGGDRAVCHLPMEISRVTKFLIQRGANVMATVISDYYRRSPLIQGGLEVPCSIDVWLASTVANDACLKRYKELITELCIEGETPQLLSKIS